MDKKSKTPTLREWLRSGPFAVSISQGFGCEFASLGAIQGLASAFGGSSAVLRAHITACSGASSGAKVAALLAHPDLDLDQVAKTMFSIPPTEVFLHWDDLTLPWRGGYLTGGSMVRFMEKLWGKGYRMESLSRPFGCTAFDLESRSQVLLQSGDLATACQASGSFPGVFAPVHFQGKRLWDLAMLYDAAGVEGLPAQAFFGCNRLLQIANTDWNIKKWVIRPPSRIPNAPQNLQVCSLIMKNQTRVVPILPPGFSLRGRAAHNEARHAVLDALDKPLIPGSEPGHFMCYVEPPDHIRMSSTTLNATVFAGFCGCLALAVLHSSSPSS